MSLILHIPTTSLLFQHLSLWGFFLIRENEEHSLFQSCTVLCRPITALAHSLWRQSKTHKTQTSVEAQPAKGAWDLGAQQHNSDCHLLNGAAVARGDWELEGG